MVEIWKESSYTTSQTLANQARFILKKDKFSDVEILKMCKQLNCEDNTQIELPHSILKANKSLFP